MLGLINHEKSTAKMSGYVSKVVLYRGATRNSSRRYLPTLPTNLERYGITRAKFLFILDVPSWSH